MARILITGGTGSLGSFLVERWCGKHELTIVSRNPHSQATLAKKFPQHRYILADICDRGEMVRACRDQDILIHAAALKQVDIGEYHPVEFIRVNVMGTVNVAEAWAATHTDNKGLALLISSDKAAAPLNGYGMTKGLATSVFRKYKFSVIRYGNVAESRGAFFQVWKIALAEGQPLLVRTPEPTRFFLTLNDAALLIEDALEVMQGVAGGGVFVPHKLKAFSVLDVARYISQRYGVQLEYEPLLPYEKVDEVLIAPGEVPMPVSGLLSAIMPGWGVAKATMEMYCSCTAPRMTAEEVLEKVGW